MNHEEILKALHDDLSAGEYWKADAKDAVELVYTALRAFGIPDDSAADFIRTVWFTCVAEYGQ